MKLAPKTPAISLVMAVAVGLVGCGSGDPTGATPPEGGSGSVNSSSGSSGSAGSQSPTSPTGGAGTGTPSTGGTGGSGTVTDPTTIGGASLAGGIVPLFSGATVLEPEVHFETNDAVVTKWGDRGRDRHGREDEFQSYDHYLPHYWTIRTARYMLTDHVTKGGSTIDLAWVTEWELDKLPEFRAWYNGNGSVAQYTGNYGPLIAKEGPGTYDNDLNKISDQGTQYKYTYTITKAIALDGKESPLAVGQFMEIEASQFLNFEVPNAPVGRDNYYGTVFLYAVGTGGMVPWYTVGDFEDKASERENSHKLAESAWLGGRTTLPYQYSDEPDNNFMQMATNLSPLNAQPFVRGRRVHHTNVIDGSHDESAENETFTELVGLGGPNYVNTSCDSCHKRNGRAPVAELGVSLDKWVFKVAGADGAKDPLLGSVLQPQGGSEGTVSIEKWTENADGTRSPTYAFTGSKPALFSARIAPQLVGLGLLEAVPEEAILALEDVNDANGDGISGKAQISEDPVTGAKRLGRFGWKAGASSLIHQIAGALNTDMGVMTSVLPKPDCGASQQDCGNDSAPELSDDHLTDLTKYISLLGVRAQRSIADPEVVHGQDVFTTLKCQGCHTTELTTSKFHPLAELRDQVIHPFTDMLLHDMGPGLADNLGERAASGSEWRTTPLWGLGLSACVTGGVEGPFQHQVCAPHHSYLHDGRARSIEEAILWHGGEGQASKVAYVALTAGDKAALLKFLESL